MCSGCGCFRTVLYAQTKKERDVVKDRPQNSKLKKFTVEERFRMYVFMYVRLVMVNWIVSLRLDVDVMSSNPAYYRAVPITLMAN